MQVSIESLSSRRFCHHGRQIAEEAWIDNGVFGAKYQRQARRARQHRREYFVYIS